MRSEELPPWLCWLLRISVPRSTHYVKSIREAGAITTSVRILSFTTTHASGAGALLLLLQRNSLVTSVLATSDIRSKIFHFLSSSSESRKEHDASTHFLTKPPYTEGEYSVYEMGQTELNKLIASLNQDEKDDENKEEYCSPVDLSLIIGQASIMSS